MEEAIRVLMVNAPFFGGLILFMVYVMKHLSAERQEAREHQKVLQDDIKQTFHEMHQEALQRYKESEVDRRELISKCNVQAERVVGAFDKTMMLLDRMEKKLDGK